MMFLILLQQHHVISYGSQIQHCHVQSRGILNVMLSRSFVTIMFIRDWSGFEIHVKKTKINQRTSGPVNAHLTSGPGIYSNDFIHVYSSRAGADNPLGINVDVNRKPLSLCPFVASFKTISLKYDFIHVFHVFPHAYSPRQGQTTYWGQSFDDNRKASSLCPYVASFKMISSRSDFIHIFNDFIHVYSPGARAYNPLGTNV